MARQQVKVLTAAANRSATVDRYPKPVFRNIEVIDRIRAMMLGCPVKRRSRTLPWGYYIDPKGDPEILMPIDEHFRLLVKAKELLKGHSYKNVAIWLSERTGCYISDKGLHKMMANRMPDDRCLLPLEDRLKICMTITMG